MFRRGGIGIFDVMIADSRVLRCFPCLSEGVEWLPGQ